MIRNANGQTALVDSIVFMILLTLASSIILGSGSGYSRQSEIEGLQQYSSDFTETLLAMEIDTLNYTDSQGEAIALNGSFKNICQLITDVTIINYQTSEQANLSGYESAILDTGNLLIRSGMGFAVCSSLEDQTLFLSCHTENEESMPNERYATQRLYDIADLHVKLTVYVWVIS